MWPRWMIRGDTVTSYALVNGRRTVYIPVTKRADASTLSVVELVKENLPKFQAAVPDDVRVRLRVRSSPRGALRHRRCHQGRWNRRDPNRVDGAVISAGLAQRVRRAGKYSARTAGRFTGALAHWAKQ